MKKSHLILGILLLGGFWFAPKAHAAIAVDATSTSGLLTGVSTTWNHTVNSSSNTILIIGTGSENTTGTITSVTYDGVFLSQITVATDTAGSGQLSTFWYLIAPPAGTFPAVVTYPSSHTGVAFGISLTGVNQTTPIDASTTTKINASNHVTSTLVTTQSNDFIVDLLQFASLGQSSLPTQDSPQILSALVNDSSQYHFGSSYYTASAPGTYTTGWTISNPIFTNTALLSALALQPAGTTPTVTMATFLNSAMSLIIRGASFIIRG